MVKRKIVQITGLTYQTLGCTSNCILYALCDDGTLWFCDIKNNNWRQVDNFIPGTEKDDI